MMDDKKRPTDPSDKPVQGRVKKPKMAQKKQIQFTEDTDEIVRLMARMGMAYTAEELLGGKFSRRCSRQRSIQNLLA